MERLRGSPRPLMSLLEWSFPLPFALRVFLLVRYSGIGGKARKAAARLTADSRPGCVCVKRASGAGYAAHPTEDLQIDGDPRIIQEIAVWISVITRHDILTW